MLLFNFPRQRVTSCLSLPRTEGFLQGFPVLTPGKLGWVGHGLRQPPHLGQDEGSGPVKVEEDYERR